jgi:hypothetical protein
MPAHCDRLLPIGGVVSGIEANRVTSIVFATIFPILTRVISGALGQGVAVIMICQGFLAAGIASLRKRLRGIRQGQLPARAASGRPGAGERQRELRIDSLPVDDAQPIG